jgi:hypothetical protein
VRDAKNAVINQIFASTNDAAALKARVDAWGEAEFRLARARAASFVQFQASSRHKLSPEQVTTLANGNIGGRGGL